MFELDVIRRNKEVEDEDEDKDEDKDEDEVCMKQSWQCSACN